MWVPNTLVQEGLRFEIILEETYLIRYVILEIPCNLFFKKGAREPDILGFGLRLRQRLHETGSTSNRYGIGTDKSCVYTGPPGSGTNRICYLVPNGSTYEGDDSIWNCTVPVPNRSRVNRVDPYHSGSDSKRI